jgi:hypothetical protein
MSTINEQIGRVKEAYVREHGITPNFLLLGSRAYDQWLRELSAIPFLIYDGMGIGNPRVHCDPDAVVVLRVSDEFLKRAYSNLI